MDCAREPLPTHVGATPTLPPAYGRALDAGLAALSLSLTPDQRTAIDGHMRLLLAWTSAINLTAIRDPAAAATSHVLDSLAAIPSLRAMGADRLLDLGSGGGLPGIPVAIALPAREALLVEPIAKKARFLATAVAAMGWTARMTVATTRAEALATDPRQRGQWPIITTRAVAATAELVELAFPLLTDGGRLVAWKRGDLDSELADAAVAVAGLGGGRIETVQVELPGLAGHRLVVVTRTGRVPAGYPRDPASRQRRPWRAARRDP